MSEKQFDYYLKGEKGEYEVVIGLEVHAQVLSEAKLFSSSATKFGSKPNSQVSLVDAAMPGMLPVINKFCIEQAIPCLDLRSTFEPYKNNPKQLWASDLDAHPGILAHRLMADSILEYFQDKWGRNSEQ